MDMAEAKGRRSNEDQEVGASQMSPFKPEFCAPSDTNRDGAWRPISETDRLCGGLLDVLSVLSRFHVCYVLQSVVFF